MTKQTEPGWYCRTEIAAIFGVSVPYLDREVRPKLPPDAQRKIGRRVFWHAASVFRILSQRPQAKAHEAASQQLALREAEAKVIKVESQAQLAKLDTERRAGEWVSREEYLERLAWLVDQLRTLGDLLKRRAGAKLHRKYNELLERIASNLEEE